MFHIKRELLFVPQEMIGRLVVVTPMDIDGNKIADNYVGFVAKCNEDSMQIMKRKLMASDTFDAEVDSYDIDMIPIVDLLTIKPSQVYHKVNEGRANKTFYKIVVLNEKLVLDNVCILCNTPITEMEYHEGCVCDDCRYNIESDYDAKCQ